MTTHRKRITPSGPLSTPAMSRVAGVALLLCAAVPAVRAADPAIRFQDVTESAGLLAPLAGLMGHGGAWGDFDGDGRIDLFVGGFADRPDAEYAPAKGPVVNHLFRNEGGGKFAPVNVAGIATPARTSGAVFADLNNDGTLELYVANNAKQKSGKGGAVQQAAQVQHSQLFRNDGGKLTEISAASGACPETLLTARNVAVLDYDADGLLDLFVIEDKFTKAPRSTLLRNLGGLKFADANEAAGLPADIFGLGLAVADVNEDGRPDLFVAHSNRLFLSQPGNRFREAVELAPVFKHAPFDAEDWPCGAAFGDLNRDGKLDLVVSAHSVRARNRVFLNGGVKDTVPQFREITAEAGLADVVPARCPHVEIQDFDNDGWPDIYVSAGWVENGAVTPLIYRHQGLRDGVPRFTAPREIATPMVYFPAGPTGDFDGDGRLDLFLINWFAGNHSRLLRNDSPAKSWLDVRVRGRTFNAMGIGSRVEVFAAGHSGDRAHLLGAQEIGTGYGYASGQPAVAHFGLGDAGAVDVVVRLPSSAVVKRANVTAGQTLVIEEP
jgi:enediyne biosynthesis protein E4